MDQLGIRELGTDMTITNSVRTVNQGGHVSRPSFEEESWELYKLGKALDDPATMAIASRDIEIARELERDPAEEIVTPLDYHGFRGCRYTSEEHQRIAGSAKTAFKTTQRPWVPINQRGAA